MYRIDAVSYDGYLTYIGLIYAKNRRAALNRWIEVVGEDKEAKEHYEKLQAVPLRTTRYLSIPPNTLFLWKDFKKMVENDYGDIHLFYVYNDFYGEDFISMCMIENVLVKKYPFLFPNT